MQSNPIHGKWIVKSVWEHASLGMDHHSVIEVKDISEIVAAIDRGGDWFAERFIDGREFDVAYRRHSTGVEMLHPAEIVFKNFGPAKVKLWIIEQNGTRIHLNIVTPSGNSIFRHRIQLCWSA